MNTQPLHLATGQHHSLLRADSLVVRCHAGLLWITASGEPGDHILRAGDSLCLQRNRHVLIGALAAATLDITSNQPVTDTAHDPAAIPGRRFLGTSL